LKLTMLGSSVKERIPATPVTKSKDNGQKDSFLQAETTTL